MATEIKIPVPDQTTTEVRIVEWKIKPGDTVKHGQVILEVESDKSVIEVESPADGTVLKLLAQVDDMVPVAQVVGFIGQSEEPIETPLPSPPPANPSPTPVASPPPVTDEQLPTSVTEIKIPVPDQTTTEVRIVEWKINPGDTVKRGQVILEVESDKSVIEVESPAEGAILKLTAQVDDMVPVAEVVGYIGQPGTQLPDTSQSQSSQASEPTASIAPQTVDGTAKASPLAQKTAQELEVNLTTIQGTGIHGKIMRADVVGHPDKPVGSRERVIASPNARRLARELNVDLTAISAGSGAGGRIVGKDVQALAANGPTATTPAPATAPASAGSPLPGTVEPLSKMRRAIGNNLQMSFRDTPHFNVTMAIDMTQAISFRAMYNSGKDKSTQISVNDLVVRATANAMKQFPVVNSRLVDNAIHYLADINIGIATALDSGLVVPVLAHADQKNWAQLAAETKRLATEARNGKIIGAGKGTFTISNLGMFGVDQFTAIINPGECAIMAVGALQQEVVVIDGMIGIKPMMKITLCSDHRIIDGATAARFLLALKQYLERDIIEG